jgi:IS5 family transposase
MIHLRRSGQRSFAEGLIEEEIEDLWEPWMRQADKVLEDEQLLTAVYEALVRRHPKSRTRGRLGTPAEIVLRMLLLKHIRNWSFNVVEREVRANLLYREFTRVGGGKVPDAKALGRQARALGPDVIKQLHQRMVELAVRNKVIQGRKMRVDTTVVETNIHYPTDSTLLGDGTRVLTGLMKKVTAIAGRSGTKLRDRMRSVGRRVMEIARAARVKGDKGKEKLRPIYRKLLAITGRVIAQAKRFSTEIASGVKRARGARKRAALQQLKSKIDIMVTRTQQVVRQTKARVLDGNEHFESCLVCSRLPRKSFARVKRASRPSSARW